MNFRVACLVSLSSFLVQPAVAQDGFVKGVYSSAEGCAALKDEKDLESDFIFLSATGFEGVEFNCQFVQVYPRTELPGWVAVALCEEPEHAYPALFSVMPLNDTTLSVGVLDIGEDDSEEEPAAATTEGVDEEEEDTGLAGEYQLCPGT
jgi:hypothetical protein